MQKGTKYGVNGVEAAFASTQMNVEVGAEDNGIIRFPCIVEIQMQRLQSALA